MADRVCLISLAGWNWCDSHRVAVQRTTRAGWSLMAGILLIPLSILLVPAAVSLSPLHVAKLAGILLIPLFILLVPAAVSLCLLHVDGHVGGHIAHTSLHPHSRSCKLVLIAC